MDENRHAFAIARLVLAAAAGDGAREERRRLRELAGIASLLDDGRLDEAELAAGASTLRSRVEHARDEHLLGMDPDEGLRILTIPWTKIVHAASEVVATRT
jgi:hypothetical protein